MARLLAPFQQLQSIQILSHAAPGSVQLGGSLLDQQSLQAQSLLLQQIGSHLNSDGDLLLYGCNLAGNQQGELLLETLAQLTQADVAASTDLTGTGGDWTLEWRSGELQSASLSAPHYLHNLAVIEDENPFVNNYLHGTAANDTLIGGLGSDSLYGSSGNDLLLAQYQDDTSETVGNSLFGEEGDDTLVGADGNDSLYGGEGNDSLIGGNGNDLLSANNGNDTLEGGAGDDRLEFSRGNSMAAGGSGRDTFVIASDIWDFNYSELPPPVVTISDFAVGPEGDRLDLSQLLGYLSVAEQRNPFAESNQSLRLQQQGDDALLQWFNVNTASWTTAVVLSSLDLNSTPLTIDNFIPPLSPDGSNQGLALNGGQYADILNGSRGDDLLVGNGGRDLLNAGYGNDTLKGGDAATQDDSHGNLLYGGGGNDLLIASNAGDKLYADRFLYEGSSHTYIQDGNDTLTGGNGNDTLISDRGSDVLSGGAGDDVFQWDVESQVTMTGGAGADTYVLPSSTWGTPSALVADFVSGPGGDKIDISNLLRDRSYLAGNPFNPDNPLLRLVQEGGDALLQLKDDSSWKTLLTLQNLDPSATPLTRENFIPDFPLDGSTLGYSLSGTESADTLTGSFVNDHLMGLAGNDLLLGKQGNDYLDGGSGADTLKGGSGSDTYIIDNVGDVIDESDELFGDYRYNETNTVISSITYSTASISGIQAIQLSGEANINAWGGRGTTSITGNAGNNRLTSEYNGYSTLDGGQGADTLVGYGYGANTYVVDNVNDQIIEQYDYDYGYRDTVQASLSWTLNGVVEDLLLTGSEAINGTGNANSNRITGNAAANVLNGAGGADTLIGGLGNDLYLVDNGADVIQETSTLTGETDSVWSAVGWTLGSNLENLLLTGSAAINGTGNAQNNKLSGNAANNVLNGAAGADTLNGGLGNDTYVVDNAGDVIQETSTLATEIDSVQSSISWTLGNNLENLLLTGSAAINGTGNVLNNKLSGNAANNVLNGAAGADTLNGGLGNDTYVVDNAGDVIQETSTLAAEIDSVQAALSWTLGSNLENLLLTGSAAINGTGNGLNNKLTGNAANNVLNGAAGADTLNGGLGNDTYVVDNAGDVIQETSTLAAEIDSVQSSISWTLGNNLENLLLTGSAAINGTGNALNNTLTGNTANNLLNGSAGHDKIDGGAGNDILKGGSGNDTLIGGSGVDQLFGETEADRFSFLKLSDLSVGSNRDVIQDFSSAQGDKIDLSALDAVLASTGTNEAFTFIGSAAFSATNASAQLRFSDGVLYGSVNADSAAEFEIRLVGVASLQSSDFIL
ncbi:Ca2+-binding RTX toxin-like protein [Pseudomonas fluvialis]|uniref:Ca2+-binding RTX toxin-like protein n=2 Tax=Pseudomonas fluvialis TaxID=1793966 RepID=A0A7X0BS33_9PSED|nr:Ca2+-binding RTX toxin-like protein [Pseudomonas fluvialis]